MSGRRVARIILTLVFVGLIASPVIMKRLAARREVAQANADASHRWPATDSTCRKSRRHRESISSTNRRR